MHIVCLVHNFSIYLYGLQNKILQIIIIHISCNKYWMIIYILKNIIYIIKLAK